MKVGELIKALKEYPSESEVVLSVLVDTNKCTEDDEHGENTGIYFVNAETLDVLESLDDDDVPIIMAKDVNYIED